MIKRSVPLFSVALVLLLLAGLADEASPNPRDWPNWRQWPDTDFSRASVEPDEFRRGGPPRDGIRSIDAPQFVTLDEADYADREPVIALTIDGDARAYPLSILMRHEIVNDTVGGVPVAVTFCPLCNASVVFDRRVAGEATTFGVTGLLRHSDLVMFDRTTASWWQQFTGEALVGARTGERLTRLPARVMSVTMFASAYPEGVVLVPNNPRAHYYGINPYVNYDEEGPFFDIFAQVPAGYDKMERVVVVGETAWRLSSLVSRGTWLDGDLRLTWTAGMASALDTRRIARGRDVGSVNVERLDADGQWELIPHDVTYAFAFAAFVPDGIWRE